MLAETEKPVSLIRRLAMETCRLDAVNGHGGRPQVARKWGDPLAGKMSGLSILKSQENEFGKQPERVWKWIMPKSPDECNLADTFLAALWDPN